MAIEAIVTDKAPAALGPYSAATVAPATRAIHVSGQLPIDPATGEIFGEAVDDAPLPAPEATDAGPAGFFD